MLAMGLQVLVDGETFEPPRTRGDCLDGGSNAERPCPWVRCKYHLAIDVERATGRVTEHGEVAEMPHTCALDIAAHPLEFENPRAGRAASVIDSASTLEAIGDVLGVTRERVRQIEVKALQKLEPWAVEARR